MLDGSQANNNILHSIEETKLKYQHYWYTMSHMPNALLQAVDDSSIHFVTTSKVNGKLSFLFYY